MTRGVAIALALLCGGCRMLPQIKFADATVTGVRDAGTPATLTSGESRSGFRVPAKSRLTIRRTDAQPATDTTPAVPAYEVSEWLFSEPTEFEQTSKSVLASTGTIDTTVAKHEIDAKQRQILLWAAIGCAVAGLVLKSAMPAWPGISNGLLLGAGLLFGAWKFAEIPWWVAVIPVALMAMKALGYKRAEWDANNDGIPDVLQNSSK